MSIEEFNALHEDDKKSLIPSEENSIEREITFEGYYDIFPLYDFYISVEYANDEIVQIKAFKDLPAQ